MDELGTAFVEFWKKQQRIGREWLHPEDEKVIRGQQHSFNLDYPAVPYIGDIRGARVVVLGANAGYSPDETPLAFLGMDGERDCLDQIARGSTARWSAQVSYYRRVNYGQLLHDGCAVIVNACAYRSNSISAEPYNQSTLEKLPSVRIARNWLTNDLLPRARSGQLLVIAKRWKYWKNTATLKSLDGRGVVFDRCPANQNLTGNAWACALRASSNRPPRN